MPPRSLRPLPTSWQVCRACLAGRHADGDAHKRARQAAAPPTRSPPPAAAAAALAACPAGTPPRSRLPACIFKTSQADSPVHAELWPVSRSTPCAFGSRRPARGRGALPLWPATRSQQRACDRCSVGWATRWAPPRCRCGRGHQSAAGVGRRDGRRCGKRRRRGGSMPARAAISPALPPTAALPWHQHPSHPKTVMLLCCPTHPSSRPSTERCRVSGLRRRRAFPGAGGGGGAQPAVAGAHLLGGVLCGRGSDGERMPHRGSERQDVGMAGQRTGWYPCTCPGNPPYTPTRCPLLAPHPLSALCLAHLPSNETYLFMTFPCLQAVVVPVDLLKIRLQLQTALRGSPGYVGPLSLLARTLRTERLPGLYRGTAITCEGPGGGARGGEKGRRSAPCAAKGCRAFRAASAPSRVISGPPLPPHHPPPLHPRRARLPQSRSVLRHIRSGLVGAMRVEHSGESSTGSQRESQVCSRMRCLLALAAASHHRRPPCRCSELLARGSAAAGQAPSPLVLWAAGGLAGATSWCAAID